MAIILNNIMTEKKCCSPNVIIWTFNLWLKMFPVIIGFTQWAKMESVIILDKYEQFNK